MRVDPDRLAELEEERAFLLRSLDDLDREHGAGDLDDGDYEDLRDGYTSRAAAVLRELDEGRAALGPKRPRRWGRTAIAVGLVVALAVGAGVAVAVVAGQRLPGSTITGDVADSVNTKLSEARGLQNTDPKSAIDRYDEVLKVEPDNAEALTYRGWLLARVGATAGAPDLVDKGEQGLDQAIAAAPTYADPYCFKAIIEFRYRNDASAAKGPVDTCLAADPPQEVRGLVEGLHAEIDAALGGGAASAPSSVPATSTP